MYAPDFLFFPLPCSQSFPPNSYQTNSIKTNDLGFLSRLVQTERCKWNQLTYPMKWINPISQSARQIVNRSVTQSSNQIRPSDHQRSNWKSPKEAVLGERVFLFLTAEVPGLIVVAYRLAGPILPRAKFSKVSGSPSHNLPRPSLFFWMGGMQI